MIYARRGTLSGEGVHRYDHLATGHCRRVCVSSPSSSVRLPAKERVESRETKKIQKFNFVSFALNDQGHSHDHPSPNHGRSLYAPSRSKFPAALLTKSFKSYLASGFHPHLPGFRHNFLAKALGATMWFFIFYRTRYVSPSFLRSYVLPLCMPI